MRHEFKEGGWIEAAVKNFRSSQYKHWIETSLRFCWLGLLSASSIKLCFLKSKNTTFGHLNIWIEIMPTHEVLLNLKALTFDLSLPILGSSPGLGRSPQGREWLPTPVFLPGEFHGYRSLAGFSPWGRKELDTTEQLTLWIVPLICIVSVCYSRWPSFVACG